MEITKAEVKTALGLTTDVELAEFFDCTKAAVGFWPENQPIPKGRMWELMARRPELFDAKSSSAKRGKAA